ncbi:MAG: fibronectin type III domain-containing protein, partial [Opitutales bacterium]
AVNSYSGNDWSGLIDAVTDADRTPPTAPGGLHSVVASSRTVTLGWDPSDDPETGVAKYWIYRDGAWIGEVPGHASAFTDSGLIPETAYRYDIQAFNAHGYASEVGGDLPVTTAPAPAVFSVNFGSSVIGGVVPIPRSQSFAAGVVTAPWWNNHFHGPGFWREAAQNDVPWVLSDGSEPTELRLRTTSPTNLSTEVIYASTQTIAPTEESTNLRLHTDSYVNSSANHHMVGVEVENLPTDFQYGWNLYVATHYSSVWAHGIHRFDLDLGMDGTVDRSLYSLHQPPGDWTDDTAFSNASQSDEAGAVGAEHSSYVVFKGMPPGQTAFSLSVTNLNPSGRRASFNALQVEALEEPANYEIWKSRHLWASPGIDDLPLADPDQDSFPNLVEYAQDLNPLRQDPPDHFPQVAVVEEADDRFLTLTYRSNASARDLSYWPLSSTDLENWVKVTIAPPDVADEVIDPDPDGDRSAELRRIKLRLPETGDPNRLFLRMFYQRN